MIQLIHLTELLVASGIKAHRCIALIRKYASKFGVFYMRYGEVDGQKLNDINIFLEQCNEAYILRKHHINQEIQYIEQKYKKK